MATVSTTTLEKQQVLDEDTLLKLVSSIDDLIDDKGLEIMKLSMQSELTQTERDKANSPSDLLHYLKRKYITPNERYARIAYSLEIIGHRFYGYRAIRKMEKVCMPPHFEVATQLHSRANIDEFFLYQCLAIACRHIPDSNWEGFIFHCAEMLNHNRSRYTTPCQVVAKMLQEGVLTTENYEDIVEEALIKAGVSESILHKYYKSCTKITRSSGSSRSCSRSRSSSCTVDSRLRTTHLLKRPRSQTATTVDTDIALEEMRPRHNTFTGHTTLTQNTSDLYQTSKKSVKFMKAESLPLIRVTDVETNQPLQTAEALESEQQTRSTDTSEEARKKNGQKKRRSAYILCGCGVLSLLGLVAFCSCLALLIAYGVQWDKIHQTDTLKCYENSSMVLAEIDHLFISSLSITEDTKHVGDFYRDIEVYQLDSTCDNLPTRKATSNFNGADFSPINGTILYALAGSAITLNICGTTNYTATELERLEVILYRDSQIMGFDFFHLGSDDEWQCKESTLLLDQWGYYTILFLPPTHEANFTYNATFTVSEIDSKQLYGRALTNDTLHVHQDTFKALLAFGVTHSCFVAAIKDSPRTLKQTVHIQLTLTKEMTAFTIGAVTEIFFILAVSVSIAVSCCYLTKKPYRQNEFPLQYNVL